ncbi:hypothetical protein GUJ93_ZPchr0003g17705 [Zizania palustris]|uniref:EF-hand domain-containing protein n=1 Tax=Zizania palustris TaxID=103762 RepID=A0A8J5VWU7_ZIZPA|nr:hypothetical protein GUJ93_ZPchr0003g17705 [Zizania palustris]
MEHVLLALWETEAEWEARIRGMFGFFDASGRGHLDHEQIEAGLSALHLPPEGGDGKGDYARELLRHRRRAQRMHPAEEMLMRNLSNDSQCDDHR